MKARVISPQGKIAELDQSLITDAPTVSDSPSVYSDHRELQVPLPRLVVGAVVEETSTTRDRVPLLAARDEAIAAYRRVVKTEPDSPAPTGYDFASRRLAKLGVH